MNQFHVIISCLQNIESLMHAKNVACKRVKNCFAPFLSILTPSPQFLAPFLAFLSKDTVISDDLEIFWSFGKFWETKPPNCFRQRYP